MGISGGVSRGIKSDGIEKGAYSPRPHVCYHKIATALGVEASSREVILTQARQLLISRGETGLANLIEKPTLTVDDYINGIGRLFS